MSKKLNVKYDRVVLVQSEGRPDYVVFELDAPSVVPGQNVKPFTLTPVQEGYGEAWLKEAFGIVPDEVVSDDVGGNRLYSYMKTVG